MACGVLVAPAFPHAYLKYIHAYFEFLVLLAVHLWPHGIIRHFQSDMGADVYVIRRAQVENADERIGNFILHRVFNVSFELILERVDPCSWSHLSFTIEARQRSEPIHPVCFQRLR